MLALLAIGWLATVATSVATPLPDYYERFDIRQQGSFEVDVSDEIGCLPDVNPAVNVNRISIYKEDDDDSGDLRLVAVAACPDDSDPITRLEYDGEEGCFLDLISGFYGGADLDVPDGGNLEGPCSCWVDDRWRVEIDDLKSRCIGDFQVVAETVDGAQALVRYSQDFYEADTGSEDPDGCGCATVGAGRRPDQARAARN